MLSYKRGTEILTSQPFVCITEKARRGQICDFCFSDSENLRRCSRCKILYFCGKKCQAAAWPDHKVECACLEKVSPDVPANPVRFFARLLIKIKTTAAASQTEAVFGQERSFADLMSHVEEIKRDAKRMAQFQMLWVTARAFLGDEYLPSVEVGLEIFGKASRELNTYTIGSYEECPIGTGLYIGPSILDHSCTPNAHAVFDGRTLLLRAAVDIECDSVDGIRISYIDLKELRRTRIEELRERYYFSCDCPRCSADEAHEYLTERSPSLTAEAKELLGEFMRADVHSKENLVRLRGLAEAFLSSNDLPATDVARSEALELLSKSCLEMGDFDAALPYYLDKLEAYRCCYGPYSPVYGVLLFTIAKLYHHKAQLPEAQRFFEKASEVVTVSHGRNHRLYRDLSEAFCHCKLELQALVQDLSH
ncbi:unnamed protein product [Ixodes hexagonus]